jgi:ribose transport system substrate-binding protein
MGCMSVVRLLNRVALAAGLALAAITPVLANDLVYLTPGLDLPFWRYLSKGVEAEAKKSGFGYQVLDSRNNAQTQLKNAQDAIARGVSGIIISPTDSSTCPSVLDLAAKAKIPVVIADIGTNSGAYVSFIISDNRDGAYNTGKALVEAMKEKGWAGGTVGISSISLARNNGKLRTAGFRQAIEEGGIKECALQQMQAYTAEETFKFTQDMLTANPEMRGMFIQTDTPTLGAVRAIRAARRNGQVAVAAFDGIPEFVDLIQKGEIVASGMQQPYLMGEKSGEAMVKFLKGQPVEKQILVPIVVVTSKNIAKLLPTITTTVFANEVH